MELRKRLVTFLRKTNRKYGIATWLKGEPRPPLGGFDLDGEKLIDWGWICVNLPPQPRRALEIGPGDSPTIPAMLALGYDVTAVDLWTDLSSKVGGFRFLSGDFVTVEFDSTFDVIVLCSVVEHIGIVGRYGSEESPDADIMAMRKVWRLLTEDGIVLVTLPIGTDAVHRPWHRVYGKERLPRLLAEFEVVKSRFLIKEPGAAWSVCSEAEALAQPVDVRRYAIGEFVLRKVEN